MTTAASVTTTSEIDPLLQAYVDDGRLPSFIAMATDRQDMLYEGAFGYSDTQAKTPLADDPVVQIASATKIMTSATALMLVADGALDLDAPISDYCPEASDLVVLDGWSAAGDPITRAPKTKVTARHLLTHTSGLSYEFWNPDIPRYMEAKSIPSIGTLSRECLFSPLIAEPGTVWEYGISLDWMGVVIEAITGRDLEDHMRTVLFEPLGMSSSGFTLTSDMSARLAKIHIRDDQGTFEPTDIIGEQNGDIKEGGGGVITTCREFCQFIQMVLNNGLWGGEQVMPPEVIDLMLSKATGDIPLRALNTVDPEASNDCEFFPGLAKSWSLAAMRMDEPAPTGRSAGSIGWAGLFNTYYWIDPIAGLGGISTTQLLPFADRSAIDAAMIFETSVNALVSA